MLRSQYIKERNDYAISNGHISNELSEKIRGGLGYDPDSNLRRELGAELSADKGKPQNNQGGVSKENANGERGLTEGKASRELDFSTEEMSDEDYRNFGWVRDNDVISAGYWKTFTTNFADAVKKDYKFNKTPAGEFMIEAYNYYDPMSTADVIVFAKGTIESPVVTRIVKIKSNDYNLIEDTRSDIYETERAGIPSKIGNFLQIYSAVDFVGVGNRRGDSYQNAQHNNRLDAERSRGSGKAERVVRVRFDEDNQTISTTYSNGDVVTEPWGKASRELDVIDYMDELAEREGREIVEPKVMSDREILVNALESIARNDAERNKLKEYKANIDNLIRILKQYRAG